MNGSHIVPDESIVLPLQTRIPLVGRDRERESLAGALEQVLKSLGCTWLIEGPPGIGKTQLVKWLEGAAAQRGVRTHWGYCLKESNAPFFPFEQIFRTLVPSGPASSELPGTGGPDLLPPVLIFPDERPSRMLHRIATLSPAHPCLIVGRERPASLRQSYPGLAQTTRFLRFTTSESEPEGIAPGQIDAIGERLASHLDQQKGSVIALGGVDYLVSQNGFSPVLKLVQFLREEAERTESHLLLNVNPATLEKREVALLCSEGDVEPTANADRVDVPGAPLTPAAAMLRYLDLLEQQAPHEPRLLVLDDVQWADPDSLRTFQFLARNVRHLPVLIVGTLRTEEHSSDAAAPEQVLQTILDKCDAEGLISRLSLRGLPAEDVRVLAESTLGLPFRRAEDEALVTLFHRTEGNPYFVQETLRQLVQDRWIQREDGGAVLRVPHSEGPFASALSTTIPPTLRRLVARRLSLLTSDELELLRWASIVGSEFDLPPLVSVLSRDAGLLREGFHHLERDLHLLEAASEPGRWSFSHPLVWEVTRAELPEPEFRKRAGELARWWMVYRPDEVEVVSRLFYEALVPTEGLPWVRKALDKALTNHAPETVERYHRWLDDLLRIGGAPPEERYREGVAVSERLLLEIGSNASLIRMLRSLTELPVSAADQLSAKILLAYALAAVNIRDARELMAILSPELEASSGKVDPKWEAVAALVRVGTLIRQAKYAAVLQEVVQIEPVLREVKEPWVKGRMAYARGHSLAYLGRIPEAKDALVQLQQLAKEMGTPFLEIFCAGLKGAIAEIEGDLEEGEASQERALSLARSRGDIRAMSVAYGNLVISCSFRGKTERARQFLAEGQQYCDRFDLKDIAEHLNIGEAYILWREERWKDLRDRCANILNQTTSNEAGRALALSFLAEAYLELDDVGAARSTFDRVEARKEELEPGELTNLLRVRSLLEERSADLSAARESLTAASRLLKDHPNMFWGGWLAAAMARWESRYGSSTLAKTYASTARSEIVRSGVKLESCPRWIREIFPG